MESIIIALINVSPWWGLLIATWIGIREVYRDANRVLATTQIPASISNLITAKCANEDSNINTMMGLADLANTVIAEVKQFVLDNSLGSQPQPPQPCSQPPQLQKNSKFHSHSINVPSHSHSSTHTRKHTRAIT